MSESEWWFARKIAVEKLLFDENVPRRAGFPLGSLPLAEFKIQQSCGWDASRMSLGIS
jgi:hypothetical protein